MKKENKIILGICAFVVLFIVLEHFWPKWKVQIAEAKKESVIKEQQQQRTQPVRSGNTEALVLMAESDIEPGITWKTPTIDYKFKIRTEGHAIGIQFTGTDSATPYPTEGNFEMPSGARQGPAIISTGKGEVGKIHVQLYKKVYI